MLVLGLETSCDETAAAVVEDGVRVRSHVVHSQVALHRPYRGVVPELASRHHVENLPGITRQAMDEAGVDWRDLDAVAVTVGPGLASSLLVGVSAARGIARRLDRPLVAVNHLEGHLHSLRFDPAAAPGEERLDALILLVSGGHTCLVERRDGAFRLLGQTVDDAAGEALDKGAALLGLPYPGGPAMEQAADGGDPAYLDLPRTRLRAKTGVPWRFAFAPEFGFSFSGLKTALRYHLRDHPDDLPARRADLAASYQAAVCDALTGRVARALIQRRYAVMAAVGGVARNRRLRGQLEELARRRNLPLRLAPPEFCTDNAAMIAGVAGVGGGLTGADAWAVDVTPGLGLSGTR